MNNLSVGHRKRLLQRFSEAGLLAFQDYEILELLLTFVIPRKDTKPIAKKLLKKYGSLNAILHSDTKSLQNFDGLGEKSALFLALIRDLVSYCLAEKPKKRSIVSERKDVEQYLKFSFAHRKDEYLIVLFIDSSNGIITTKELGSGTVNQCVVYPRKVYEEAFKCGAASIIVAHNHPGGSIIPSHADWQITQQLYIAGKYLGVTLLDHLLITREQTVSLRELPKWPN